jgi:anoctamin-10
LGSRAHLPVVNIFLELGLPFVMRFVDDWRAGKTTIKEAIDKRGNYNEQKGPAATEQEVEKRFMDKVERELALPDYNLFSMCMRVVLFQQTNPL